jgi:hypothetical protein
MNLPPRPGLPPLRAIRRGLAAALCAGLLATPAAAVDAIDNVVVRDDQLPTQPFYVLDLEDNYLPNVVLRENGAASFEALKAQAVAARSFTYYKLYSTSATFLRNSQSDQVYSLGGVRSNPGGLWDQAVRETAGEILSYNDIITAAFYVAGAIPSGPSAVASTSDPDPTNTERWVTYTFENGLLGSANRGTPLGFQGAAANRGAQSQNGADFLSDNGTHYLDILKYYYGGDIQVEQAVTQPGRPVLSRKPLATFDRNDSIFNRSLTFSGSTTNLGASSDVERSTAVATTLSGASQKLTFDYDASADTAGNGFTARHLAGASFAREATSSGGSRVSVASPVANVILPTFGTVGFSLLANPGDVDPDADLTVSLLIDDLNADGDVLGLEQSLKLGVIADGQWHTYWWGLDDTMFNGFLDTFGDGALNERFSLDSIYFEGFGDAVVYLDDVFYDAVVVPEPTVLALLGLSAIVSVRRPGRRAAGVAGCRADGFVARRKRA